MLTFDWISSIVALVVFLLYILLLVRRYRTRRSRFAIQFSTTNQLKSVRKTWRVRYQWVPLALNIMAVLFLLIAFARPREGLEVIKMAREGIAIQMVIDRSSSMKEPLSYQGLELDRLGVVKKVFEAFVLGKNDELTGRGNDMIGLTSFAGFVEENAPITLDHQTLVSFAKTIQPASRVEDGTMIGDAIYHATLRLIAADELLKKTDDGEDEYKIKSKIIIILTDGQQTRGGMNPLEAAEVAKRNDIKVYTIAIVSDDRYRRRESVLGQFFSLVNRNVDTTLLEEVAAITEGVFAKASSGEGLLDIYRQINELEKTEFEERFTTYKELFPVFVIIGLVLLLLEILITQTLFRRIP